MINTLAVRESKRSRSVVCFGITLVAAILLSIILACKERPAHGAAQQTKVEDHTQSTVAASEQDSDAPVVIWFHNCIKYPNESLSSALSGGFVTHVILLHYHPRDADFADIRHKVEEAVRICHDAGVHAIWMRCLWPTNKLGGFNSDTITDSRYYALLLAAMRREEHELNADFTGLDLEFYGDMSFREGFKKDLPETLYNRVREAVVSATTDLGAVDYVMPAAGSSRRHIYNITAMLGRIRISETTYFDRSHLQRSRKRTEDIFGAYVGLNKDNPFSPEYPFYTAEELRRRKDLWFEGNGLLLFPYPDDVQAIAAEVGALERLSGTAPQWKEDSQHK